jgi:hypothetical protein
MLPKGLGMPAVDIADDPWTILATAQELRKKLPALINVQSCRMNWHVGVGTDGPPEWDRLALVDQRLTELGLAVQAAQIRQEEQISMEKLWAQ